MARRRQNKAQRVISKMRLPSILRTKKRQKEVKLRKNFLPTLVVIFVLWSSVAYMIFFVDPTTSAAIPIFFLLVFLTLLFTTATLFAHTRRGIIISSFLTVFLILLYLGVGTLINFILLLLIALIIEVYFIKA